MPARWLDELNPAQREAVTHDDGPLLVVAGAGTGKTKTLACRVAHLVESGVPPYRILLLTFTRRAAAEMLRRADGLTGQTVGSKVWGGTFHSVGNRLLRMYGRAVGLSPDFTVMDQGDAADVMNLLRTELGVAKTQRRFPRKRTLVEIFSRMVNSQEKLKDTLARYFPWCQDDIEALKLIFDGYVRRKREQNVLDYDDLLAMWSELCVAPEVGAAVADRFEHVLVDEYQDTNPVQADILRGMRQRYGNIMVVGDDAQSIYSFRAATIRNILDFPKRFPGARLVVLEQNYRSTQPILAASNAVMEKARERYTKNLFSGRESKQKPLLFTCLDEAEQCELVCRNILEHHERGIPLARQAVLFRASHHSDQLEVELARRNLPFHKFGGLKFIEAAHIKDALAFLRILDNPFDEISWYRVLQLLDGVGPKAAQRIVQALGVRRAAGQPARGTGAPVTAEPEFATPLKLLLANPPPVPPAAEEQFARFREVVADCLGAPREDNRKSGKKQRGQSAAAAAEPAPADGMADAPAVGQEAAGTIEDAGPVEEDAPRPSEPPLAVQLERIRRFYEPLLKQLYENAPARLGDLEQLEQIAQRYRSRRRFVTDLTLDPPASTSDLAGQPYSGDDYLVLSTIHSAKGCEWDVVHIIHAADGMIPSDMALLDQAGIDEERRLFYVAMTRAKDALYVYFPLRYYHRRWSMGDAHSYAQLTRFIPQSVRKHFEERTTDPAGVAQSNPYQPAGYRAADRRLQRLWE